jgi:hypothetical protein
MQTIFCLSLLVLSASAYVDNFVDIPMPRGQKIRGNQVDLTRAIKVDSEFDCIELCRKTSIYMSPFRTYDSACDTTRIYENGCCYINEIPSLSDFIYDRSGHEKLFCPILCAFMSDCHMVQTEFIYRGRRTFKQCSFINNDARVVGTRLAVEIQMKQQLYSAYQRDKKNRL